MDRMQRPKFVKIDKVKIIEQMFYFVYTLLKQGDGNDQGGRQ